MGVQQRRAMNTEVVKLNPGDKLCKILSVTDFIRAPLVLLFYPRMNDEILQIIRKKDLVFGSAHVAFISKEKLQLPRSEDVWFITDDDQQTIFNAFGVVGNNCKAAIWIEEKGIIMTKIQQLINMKFLLDNLIPNSGCALEKTTGMPDKAMKEYRKRKEPTFSWKIKPIIVRIILFPLIILLAVFLGFGYEFGY